MGQSKISKEEIIRLSSIGVNAAKERFGATLDYSENSLHELDNILEKAYLRFNDMELEGKLTEESIKRTSKIWGSYLGVVIQENNEGYWVKDDENLILIINNNKIDPIGFVHSRITSEPNLRTADYYKEIIGIIVSDLIDGSKLYITENDSLQSVPNAHHQDSLGHQEFDTRWKYRKFILPIGVILTSIIFILFFSSAVLGPVFSTRTDVSATSTYVYQNTIKKTQEIEDLVLQKEYYEEVLSSGVDYYVAINELTILFGNPRPSSSNWIEDCTKIIASLEVFLEEIVNLPVPNGCQKCNLTHDNYVAIEFETKEMTEDWKSFTISNDPDYILEMAFHMEKIYDVYRIGNEVWEYLE